LNYRSVVVLGSARRVDDLEEKLTAMKAVIQRFLPAERIAQVRELADYELNSALVVAVPLEEASSKIRRGPGSDEKRDRTNPVWAGELPLHMSVGDPVPDDLVPVGTPSPEAEISWVLRGGEGVTH
jgi:hypothetical protein